MRIALIEPEIPGNTGAIGRVCVGTGTPLHLVGQLGFDLSEKAVRRAGLDYWKHVDLHVHDQVDPWFDAMDRAEAAGDARLWLLSSHGTRRYDQVAFRPTDVLVFGSESRGLPQRIKARYAERMLYLPILPSIRSLNLASAATTVLYEALRQQGFPGLPQRT